MARPAELTPEQKAERKRVMAIDGAKALAEYQAAIEGQDGKIARLRALRLERDRLAAEAANGAKPKRAASKSRK